MGKKTRLGEAFVAAVSNGHLEQAESLMAQGYNINQTIDGATALHFVVNSRSSIAGFEWLLENGASLDQRDNNDLTPLMIACGRTGAIAEKMALELIRAGSDVTIRRASDGMSAIEFAAKSSTSQVIRALVTHGSELNGPNEGDLFPALIATRAGNLSNLKTLVKLGCDLGKTTEVPWARGMTCLGIARLENQHAVVEYLEKLGAP